MKSKINLVLLVPLFGTFVIILHLFKKKICGDIDGGQFIKTFILCGLLGGLCWIGTGIVLSITLKQFDQIFLIAMIIVAGYLMNLCCYLLTRKIN